MRTKADIDVVTTMERFGGSFARALGQACVLADDANLERIKAAFPELWQEYHAMSVLQAARASALSARGER